MLRKVPIETITLGMELPGNVCDQQGTTLLPAGLVINEQHLASLAGRRFRGLFVGEEWPAELLPEAPERTVIKSASGGARLTLASKASTAATAPVAAADTVPVLGDATEPEPGLDGQLVPIDQLRVGSVLQQDLYDPRGALLLSAGHEISARFLFLLRQRGALTVRMHADDIAQATKASRPLRGGAVEGGLKLRDLRAETARSLERHADAAHELQDLCAALARGRSMHTDKVKTLVADFSDMVALDPDLLSLAVATQRSLGEYLFDHCVNVAMLSVATLHQLGMDREQIQQVGLGAIFQDIGMLRLSPEIRMAGRALTPAEWQQIRRHPTYTCDRLENARGVSPLTANISFQVHERTDGSGYPRGRLNASIHPGARVVAIADAYAAMTRPRPYRTAHLPHQAMQELLRECRRNRFDRAALKSFLDVMSLYPIGSFVQLGNGQRAQVIRAHAGAPMTPTVAILDPTGRPSDTTIDLRYADQVAITRAVATAANE